MLTAIVGGSAYIVHIAGDKLLLPPIILPSQRTDADPAELERNEVEAVPYRYAPTVGRGYHRRP